MARMTKTEKRAAETFGRIGLKLMLIGFLLLLIFIFKAGELVALGIDQNVYYIILLITGISAAMYLFGVLKSDANYEGKTFYGYLKLGGSIVGVALFVVLGLTLVNKAGPFHYTFWLQDANGKTVLKNQGKLRIRLGDRIETREIDENGSVTFKQIPRSFAGKTIQVELEAPRWLFEDGKSTTECKLKITSSRLIIKPDTKVFGTIVDEEGNGIEGAKISIGDRSVLTGQNGDFKINAPPASLTGNVSMTVSKDGHKTITEHVSPGNPQEIRLKLKVKKGE